MNISPNRITGLATGMDTDNMVKQMMKPYVMKVDKQKQQRDLAIWQQELFRGVTKSMRDMYDKYFDVLSKDSILSAKNLASTSATVKDSTIADITSLTGAKAGGYKINVKELATPPFVKTGALEEGALDKEIETDTILKFKVGTDTTEITIKAGTKVKDMIAEINSKGKTLGVKASYSSFTKDITIETANTGSKSFLEIEGLDKLTIKDSQDVSKPLFENLGTGSNYGKLSFEKFLSDEKMDISSLQGREIGLKDKDGNEIKVEDKDTIETLMGKIKTAIGDTEGTRVKYEKGRILVDNEIKFDGIDAAVKSLQGKAITIGSKAITIDETDTLSSLVDKIKSETGLDASIQDRSIVFSTG
ncbi:flagellar cap protein FliD N-terminal domain-containing protein, partial [Clostridium sp.]|uniref:flagellar cap protein FliD N-terminal domain-containing protein n=1 Tax=Clostridium sp. TaxID=1506 RepID=UPI003463DE77